MADNIDTRNLDTVSGAVYFSVGRGTEGGAASYHLAIAGVTVGTSEPSWGQVGKVAQNSGYSLGAIQVDFGQRGTWPLGSIDNRTLQPGEQTYVDAVIQQASAYAKAHNLPFTEDQSALRSDLLSHGNGLNGRTSLNFIDTGTRDSINAWAGSAEGKQWIHSNIDYPQVRNATQTAMSILDTSGSNISEDRRFEAISLLAKTANQLPSQLPKLEKVLKDGGDYDALRAKADEIRETYRYYDGPKAANVAEKYENGYANNREALDRAHAKVSGKDFDPSTERSDPDVQKALELVNASPTRQTSGLLKEGSIGKEVRKLESNLSVLGYTDVNGNALQVDQQFDASTKHAVETFQRSNGLTPVDGKAGPATLGLIDQQARDLQANLAKLGFTDATGKPLSVDGYLGDGTRQAVQSFQEANGLTPTGIADPSTSQAVAQKASQLQQPGAAPIHNAPLLSDPNHSRHTLFQQMLEKVHGIEAARGIQPGIHSECLAGALSAQAIHNGLTSVDRVELNGDGSMARAVQVSGVRDEASLNRTTDPISTAQAINQTLQDSSERAREALFAEHARELERSQQQTQANGARTMAV
ncbi:peptidoglycan-binding domain-containing protein [Xanthomonas bonasiae]|uniref:peptidoglycan-binding domain-containing protein n=1 Tax=Xanthomonas bonasiae TaxID=2810351 RepID=UPI00197E64BB|nr:peptidoglycan-binding protein [Xanthomonas bonasiae]MBN6110937.1 peptidoglycan-binding protein [Xanthomonas bonasiae]